MCFDTSRQLLPSRGQQGAVSGDRKQTTYAFVSWRVARNPFLHMALSHGYRLGPYEVRSRVGASGVGGAHGAKILFEKSVVQDASR